ncbi:class I SAM-dependent methyltransferase [Maribellus sediminis]|uniref:class I SAM-dependent methyltransferase n=1 Tax=Maribellus sediminis TaxID=2696285 RepID=UPI00142FB6AC|nr:class I SAM-dependent methyltransferase [Maribellus sediminis]
MNDQSKETYWSQYVDEFEQKQQRVVGDNILFLMKDELLKEQELGEVLELGCGTGLFTEALQKVAGKVLATDFSEEMVTAAQEKRANLKHVKFEKANALNLEYGDASFDTVFMANLIHVIGNAEKLIQESKRVLKKEGRLIITSFAITEMNFFARMAMGIRYIKTFGKPSDDATREKTTRKSVEKLLISNDFEITKSVLLGNKSKAFYISCIKR